MISRQRKEEMRGGNRSLGHSAPALRWGTTETPDACRSLRQKGPASFVGKASVGMPPEQDVGRKHHGGGAHPRGHPGGIFVGILAAPTAKGRRQLMRQSRHPAPLSKTAQEPLIWEPTLPPPPPWRRVECKEWGES